MLTKLQTMLFKQKHLQLTAKQNITLMIGLPACAISTKRAQKILYFKTITADTTVNTKQHRQQRYQESLSKIICLKYNLSKSNCLNQFV